ncbi:unnamed protein product [Heligmosomoides polygyrus]|uniref:Uncharacterized protein n=1 Tax=Heligmosomoides polygyrus TaxID=6339 RepID=A0A183GGJ3_HELPZ|nr:unnamed protein product [Heligmosomoides polygyrus]
MALVSEEICQESSDRCNRHHIILARPQRSVCLVLGGAIFIVPISGRYCVATVSYGTIFASVTSPWSRFLGEERSAVLSSKMMSTRDLSRVMKITVEETEAAIRKMKPGKVTGPDDLAADLWKSKSWYPPEWRKDDGQMPSSLPPTGGNPVQRRSCGEQIAYAPLARDNHSPPVEFGNVGKVLSAELLEDLLAAELEARLARSNTERRAG